MGQMLQLSLEKIVDYDAKLEAIMVKLQSLSCETKTSKSTEKGSNNRLIVDKKVWFQTLGAFITSCAEEGVKLKTEFAYSDLTDKKFLKIVKTCVKQKCTKVLKSHLQFE